ncbi:MAG: hypothetical protein HY401_08415 [Elusimicrobia bacterium]|nr:hypothetical protein [Elusimicrobiota bacterium]
MESTRENFRLFEPDELTPEERLERVIELLTEASLDLAKEESDEKPAIA